MGRNRYTFDTFKVNFYQFMELTFPLLMMIEEEDHLENKSVSLIYNLISASYTAVDFTSLWAECLILQFPSVILEKSSA